MIEMLKALVNIGFALSLPLRWYQNYWMGTDRFDRPIIMRSGFIQMGFLLITFVLTYGGIAGIWWFFGFWPALLAFMLKWWVGRTSWKIYFNRQVAAYADHYYREMVKVKTGHSDKISNKNVFKTFNEILMPDDLSTWDGERMRREALVKAYDMCAICA